MIRPRMHPSYDTVLDIGSLCSTISAELCHADAACCSLSQESVLPRLGVVHIRESLMRDFTVPG